MLVFVAAVGRDDQLVNDDDLFAAAIASLARRWFWWFFLGGTATIPFGDVRIKPLGYVTAPLVVIALWRLIELAPGPVRRRLQQALGCGVVAAVVVYIAAPVLPDAQQVTFAVGYCFLMLGMAAFAGGLRAWLEHRGCEPGLVNIWTWAGRWAAVNAVAAAGVAVVGVLVDETFSVGDIDGWAALGWVPFIVGAIAPFFTAAMATDELRKGLDRQLRLSI